MNMKYVHNVHFRARNWVRSALIIIRDTYGKKFINLEKMFGRRYGKQIAKNACTASNNAMVSKLIESDETLAELWKRIKYFIANGNYKKMMTEKEYVAIIVEIFINEMPIIGPLTNRFSHVKPLNETNITIDKNGLIIIPTSNWKNGEKVERKITFDSLPKAIRGTQHTIDSLVSEYKQNNELINCLDDIIRYMPQLGKGSTDEERRRVINELLIIAKKLRKKRHKFKVESKQLLSTLTDKIGAIDLIKSSNDPERIRKRKERNWPAALMKVIAVRDRFIKRNVEIIELLKPALYKRRQNLLASYEQFVYLHDYIDNIVIEYIDLLYKLEKNKTSKNIQPSKYWQVKKLINLINNWLTPYLHDKTYNHMIWEIGEKLVNSVRALNRSNIQQSIDYVLDARVIQLRHYQALIMDKENKNIEVGTEKDNIPYQAKT